MKLPAIHLYPGDWLRDNVAGCSLAAQGLWLRMMFVGHDSEAYGRLQSSGRALTADAIARRCGCVCTQEYSTLLAELDHAGVPSRDANGTIYSRRMVRDAAIREIRAGAGSKGGSKTQAKRQAKSKENTEIENDNTSSRREEEHRIEELYQLFPRKKNPRTAKLSIARALKRATFEEIKAGVIRYAAERKGQDPQFTRHPATWFNGDSWRDESDGFFLGDRNGRPTKPPTQWPSGHHVMAQPGTVDPTQRARERAEFEKRKTKEN